MKERWKSIKSHPEYAVSTHGRIKRIAPAAKGGWALVGRILKQRKTGDGYFSLELSRKGKSTSFLVHTLVALTFIGKKPSPTHQVAHWDNKGDNNFYKNLRWATPKENDNDKERHGTRPRGLKNGNSKLSDKQVRHIRALNKKGVMQCIIAKQFKVDGGFVSRICNKKRRAYS